MLSVIRLPKIVRHICNNFGKRLCLTTHISDFFVLKFWLSLTDSRKRYHWATNQMLLFDVDWHIRKWIRSEWVEQLQANLFRFMINGKFAIFNSFAKCFFHFHSHFSSIKYLNTQCTNRPGIICKHVQYSMDCGVFICTSTVCVWFTVYE